MSKSTTNVGGQAVTSALATVVQANATQDPEFLQKVALVDTSPGGVKTNWREARTKRNRLRMTGEAPPSCAIPRTAVEGDVQPEKEDDPMNS